MMVFFTSSIQAQKTKTPCKITVASGEVFEGFIRQYEVKTTNFNLPFKLFEKEGVKGRKINVYHIMLIEINGHTYKPKVDSDNQRKLMLVLNENEDFSAYVDFATERDVAFSGHPIETTHLQYYFIKDEEVYKVPRKIASNTFYYSLNPLISTMQTKAKIKNVVLPDYIANY